jgi:ketosteroid isomerase-like protein
MTKYDSAETQNMQITVFGDTAIVTAEFKAHGTFASGKPFNWHTRYTDVWAKTHSGKWQLVATQDSRVQEPH